MRKKKAIVLLSGGLDSATALFWAKKQGYETRSLSFDYGQRHKRETQCAKRVAKSAKSSFELVRFDLPWGGSALLSRISRLPEGRGAREMAGGGIPATYVPARNTIFLSFALSFADASGADAIVIGANAVDYSGYPDCRPQFMSAFQSVAKLGTKSGSEGKKINILAPLIRLSKAQIVRLGTNLKVPYGLTWSCYQGGKKPCGKCDSCILRQKGFDEAGIPDPIFQ